MGTFNIKLLAFLLFLSVTGQTLGQSVILQPGSATTEKVSENRLKRIDSLLNYSIDKRWINGAVGMIIRNGKIIYNKSFGMDDVDAKTPLRTDAIFRIASQTKAITSAGVMILFDEGKITLDDPISKYIPAFANPVVLDKFNASDITYTTVPAKREITIKDLLTHTSGLDYPLIGSQKMVAIYGKAGISPGFESKKILLATEINKLAKLPLANQPGEKFTYGLSVDVLGYLIEVVSGKSLSAFLTERIFTPLGMSDTFFYLPASKQSRLVSLYTEDPQKNLIKWTSFGNISASYPNSQGTYYSGGAGLSSTIKDYAIFLQTMLNGGEYNGKRILTKNAVGLMTSNQIGDLNEGLNKFGLGFEVTPKRMTARPGLSEGSFAWGGYFGTVYWADPQKGIIGQLYMQQSPLSHGDIQSKFKSLVYEALEE